jgi:hypothetical protein
MTDSFQRLKTKTIAHASAIIGSRLSWEEAYWSYILYFIPKVNYQLSLLSLTKE